MADNKKVRKGKRIGNVGEAYLEAVEKKRASAAEAMRRIRASK